MTKKTQNYYSLPCEPLNSIIQVTMLSPKQEEKLLDSVIKRVNEKQDNFSISSYKENFITLLIRGGVHLLSQILIQSEEADDSAIKLFYTNSLFNTILKVYPYLDLDIVCNNTNVEHYLKKNKPDLTQPELKKILKRSREIKRASAEPVTSVSLSSLEEIENLEKMFSKEILGQEEAVKAVTKILKLMATDFISHAGLMFVGSTGTGKTKLAELLGEVYSGNFFKINCAEYTGSHEYAKLIGAPPGYIGHSESSLLGEKAKKSNQWVFLFDEFEKANSKLHDFLLSLLDDGTCTDNLGKELDFSRSIFIFTSNQGISDIKYNRMGFIKNSVSIVETKEVILDSIKNKFNPEFINRLDHIICFNPLTEDIVVDIVRKEFDSLPIQTTEELVTFVVKNGYSQEYGARNIKRFVRDNFSLLVADEILNKKVPTQKSQKYSIVLENDKPKIVDTKDYKEKRKHVKTKPVKIEPETKPETVRPA